MFISNPDQFLMPSIRISPFKTKHIGLTYKSKNNFAFDYFNEKFGKDNWRYTINGREAIKIALKQYNLKKNDIVTIITTSNNYYISSCVTNEIDKVCQWNREIVPETKILFVNHEFGYPYEKMDQLLKLKIPIIEDFCTSFFINNKENKIGLKSDFSIYSFPKFFPVQIGGLLVSNSQKIGNINSVIKTKEIEYIENIMSYHLENEDKLLNKRKINFKFALDLYCKIGFSLRFKQDDKIIPSLLLLKNNGIINELKLMKEYLSNNGIQSSVFYGEDTFFVPNHQNLTKNEK